MLSYIKYSIINVIIHNSQLKIFRNCISSYAVFRKYSWITNLIDPQTSIVPLIIRLLCMKTER